MLESLPRPKRLEYYHLNVLCYPFEPAQGGLCFVASLGVTFEKQVIKLETMPNTGHQGVQLTVWRWPPPLRQPFVIRIIMRFDDIQNRPIARICFHKPSSEHPVVFGPVAGAGTAFSMFERIVCQSDEPQAFSVIWGEVGDYVDIVQYIPDM